MSIRTPLLNNKKKMYFWLLIHTKLLKVTEIKKTQTGFKMYWCFPYLMPLLKGDVYEKTNEQVCRTDLRVLF